MPPATETIPEPFDDELPSEVPMEGKVVKPPIALTTEQASDAGMENAEPGDTYTVRVMVEGTVDGLTVRLLPGSATKDGVDNLDDPSRRNGKQKVRGPKDFDMGDEYSPTGV